MDAAAHLHTVTKFTGEVNDPDNVPEAVANAFRAAMTEPRGAAALVLPRDVMSAPTAASITRPLPIGAQGPAPAESVRKAVDLFRGARRPVLLVGARAGDPDSCAAIRELISGAELPVVETFQATGVVSRALEERYVGRVGLFRNQPGDVLIAHADVVVTVGYDPVEYDPDIWNADVSRTIVHIDSHPADIDNHYQPTLELRGDVAATVGELVKPLAGVVQSDEAKTDVVAQRRRLADIDDEARKGHHGPQGLNPAAVCLFLRDAIDDETTVACDIGSHSIYMCRHFRVYEPRHLLISDGQQTLGVALPWAMAATLARPGKPAVSVSGDGGFLFSAQELQTAHRMGMTFTHVIMRDNTYDMVGFQELLAYGRKSGVQLGDYDIVNYAAAFGAHGYRVSTEEEFTSTLAYALAEDGPSIIDVPVDYSHNTELFADLPADRFE
jgi:acetolactate synthase-1/2/3 large subunit